MKSIKKSPRMLPCSSPLMKANITLILCLSWACMEAQEFKEGLLYDVHGPIKEIVPTGDNSPLPNIHSKASFNPDGKSVHSIMIFDKAGYPLGWTMDTGTLNTGKGSINGSLKVNYDQQHRISSTVMEGCIDMVGVDLDLTEWGLSQLGSDFSKEITELISNVMTETRSFQYRNNSFDMPEISQMQAACKVNGEDMIIDYTYSDYIYDKRGNWVSRNVEETLLTDEASDNPHTRKYVETRVITYYD